MHPDKCMTFLTINQYKIMEKKCKKRTPFKKRGLNKLIVVMKISLLLTFMGLLQVHALVHSQDAKLDLNYSNLEIRDVLKELENQSEYRFFYSENLLNLEKRVNISVKNANIQDVLENLLANVNLTYRVFEDNLVVITAEDNVKQGFTVTGKITNAAGIPLPGVNIVEKGTTNGAVTDLNGNYSISVSDPNAVLVYSFVGYLSEEISINGQTAISVTLVEDIQSLDEVVVVGYGTQVKRDITGSIATVESKEIEKLSTSSFDEALQGMAAGVNVTTTSGVPGAATNIKIRGINSITADTDPLWVIDGMPVYSGNGLENSISTYSQNPMSMINPSDIASIEILKDAAATAIYGSRGSSGVILITTKTGSKGKGTVNVDYSTGVSDLLRKPEDIGFVNTQEWFMLMDEALANSGQDPADPQEIIENSFPLPITPISREEAEQVNTNWFDEIMRTGSYQNLNVSTSTGSELGQLYASFNYRDDKGVLKSNDFKRYTGRMNADITPVKYLTLGAKINLSFTDNERVKNEGGGGFGDTGGGRKSGFAQANIHGLPWMPVHYDDDPTGYWNPASGSNLAAMIDPDLIMDNVKQYRGIGGAYINFQVPGIDGLSLRTEGAIDFIQNNSVFWVTEHLTEIGSRAIDRAVTNKIFNFNGFATYTKTFGNHYLNAVAGAESMSTNRYIRDMEGRDLVGMYRELGNPATLLNMSAKLTGEEYLLAYFGRLNYKFQEKYLLGLSARRDGSSKFLSEYRWGNFLAVSAGWIMTEESFMQSLDVINFLKLRGSLGQTGNKDIPNNLTETYFNMDLGFRYVDPTLIGGGTRVNNIGVPSLTWETTDSYDAGIDFGLFENRISGSVAYYRQDVFDLLLKAPIPSSVGVPSGAVWNNIGDMRNQGIEFSFNSVNISNSDFSWRTTFNISTNQNEVLRLTPDVDREGAGIITRGKITKTGGSLNTYYMAESAGIDPDKGVEMIYEIDIDHFNETGETVKTGKKIPATENNCNLHRIIHEGKTNIPTYFGGLSNQFMYKNFDFSFLLSFSGGNYLYDMLEIQTTIPHSNFVMRKDLLGNYWQQPGDEAKYMQLTNQGINKWAWDPAANDGEGDWIEKDGIGKYGYGRQVDRYLYKADFLKVRNIQFGYNLPLSVVSKIGMSQFRVYVSAQNVFTFTGYKGYDPENTTWVGENMPLPSLRVFSIGANIKF